MNQQKRDNGTLRSGTNPCNLPNFMGVGIAGARPGTMDLVAGDHGHGYSSLATFFIFFAATMTV